MTMNFRIAKTNIVEILFNNTKNCFQVIGHQRQAKSADEVIDNNRLVQVFYSFGDIPKSAGRQRGPVQHDATYRIELTVSSPAQVDLSTLNNPNSSEAELDASLISSQEASSIADDLLDELYDLVYQILMDPTNADMGMTEGIVSNRWIDQFQKDDPLDKGELVVLTGSMFLKLRIAEQITGISPTTNGDIQNVTIDIDSDDVEKTAIKINT